MTGHPKADDILVAHSHQHHTLINCHHIHEYDTKTIVIILEQAEQEERKVLSSCLRQIWE